MRRVRMLLHYAFFHHGGKNAPAKTAAATFLPDVTHAVNKPRSPRGPTLSVSPRASAATATPSTQVAAPTMT